MELEEAGRTLRAVLIGSPNVNPGYRLVADASYPGIAADYDTTFGVLKALPCDLFLGAHGSYFDLATKHARLQSSPSSLPFVDPEGYAAYVSEREQAFRAELERQRAAAAAVSGS